MSIGQQVISQLIDEKLLELLRGRIENLVDNVSPGSGEGLRPEIDACTQLLYSYFTYNVAGRSPGMRAMMLRYAGDHRRRYVVYLCILLHWIHQRALKVRGLFVTNSYYCSIILNINISIIERKLKWLEELA